MLDTNTTPVVVLLVGMVKSEYQINIGYVCPTYHNFPKELTQSSHIEDAFRLFK
jgi:hypothetical protein